MDIYGQNARPKTVLPGWSKDITMQFNSRKEIIEDIRNLVDPLPEDLRHRILDEGCVFGSYVFGGFKQGVSDIDVLLYENKKSEILTFGELVYSNLGVYVSEDYSEYEFRSIYTLSESGQIYNLMFFHNREDLAVWIKAAHLMKKILKSSKYFKNIIRKRKKARVELFEYLKDLQRVDWENDEKEKMFVPLPSEKIDEDAPF